MKTELHEGDCLEILRFIPDESINCIVTSPPYWGLRDYGHGGQIGLEQSFPEYLAKLIEVFEECRRVLRKDGTMWVNMGDSYSSSSRGTGGASDKQLSNAGSFQTVSPRCSVHVPEKNLLGQPWRLAFALQDAGWILRSDIIWHKPNPMPESVTDRPTRAHEYVFLFVKSKKYYYNADAIREGLKPGSTGPIMGANARDVWSISPRGYKGAHFAVFPEALPEKCILAGCPPGGTVLDPFAGSGTTLAVAHRLGRNSVGIELNSEYISLARARIAQVQR